MSHLLEVNSSFSRQTSGVFESMSGDWESIELVARLLDPKPPIRELVGKLLPKLFTKLLPPPLLLFNRLLDIIEFILLLEELLAKVLLLWLLEKLLNMLLATTLLLILEESNSKLLEETLAWEVV